MFCDGDHFGLSINTRNLTIVMDHSSSIHFNHICSFLMYISTYNPLLMSYRECKLLGNHLTFTQFIKTEDVYYLHVLMTISFYHVLTLLLSLFLKKIKDNDILFLQETEIHVYQGALLTWS